MLARIKIGFRTCLLAGACAAVLVIPAAALDNPQGARGAHKRTHAASAPARHQAAEQSEGAAAPAKHGRKQRESHAKGGRGRRHHAIHGPEYRPPHAEILVDENSGRVMHEQSSDSPCHPASLTKIMTLYLLFEQLESGKLTLDTALPVSANAARQAPTKLGLKVDQTIKVEDAIKAIVTKSANDAAVVVGEALGGTESDFARLMTEKATALGMTGTTYVNASGLPADAQLTTARDQAILARAISERFPRYYPYFATLSFHYHGIEMRNHNSLLGRVEGVDGIKTGYTDASGYNLVSSVRRGERHIVAVVLGGTSNGARDARMRQLIEEYIGRAATKRTAPAVVESARPDNAGAEAKAPAAAPPPAAVAPEGSARPDNGAEVKVEAAAPPPVAAAPEGSAAAAVPTAKTEQASTSDRTAIAKVPAAAGPPAAPTSSSTALPPVVPLQ
jgi:D-alanyl-D-alanine carboxypeptidase